MPGSFDRFDESARQTMSLADGETRRFNHNFMGTEHLLLALTLQPDTAAVQVLDRMGIDPAEVRAGVEAMLGQGERQVRGEIGLTPRAKKVIELAVDEARRMDHHAVGTEHLLLGLLRERDGIAAGVLTEMGAELDRMRRVSRVVRRQPEEEHLTPGAALTGEGGIIPGVGVAGLDQLTPGAQRVIALAADEARRFNHNYIGTEHLLLGLTREEEGIAARALTNLRVDNATVRRAVEFIIGRGERQVTGEIGLTPRAKKVVDLAREEARRRQHRHVGTEHLLLGLIREGEGIAAGVLESLGVSLKRVRTEVDSVIPGAGSESPPSASTASPLPAVPARWDYLVAEIGRRGAETYIRTIDGEETHRFKDVSLHWALQVLGDGGWELVSIEQPPRGQEAGALYVFKRPK